MSNTNTATRKPTVLITKDDVINYLKESQRMLGALAEFEEIKAEEVGTDEVSGYMPLSMQQEILQILVDMSQTHAAQRYHLPQ